MRFIQLTSGTGSFYCGTCLRDNALVVELRRQGHDALMVPLYLPPTLDEAAAPGEAPLFYGGINVYLQHKAPLFRKTPRWMDRLLDAPGLLRAAGSRAGMTTARELADLTLSMLRGEQGNQVKELDRLADWLEETGRPDVVCFSNALLLGMAPRIKQRTGAPILCFLNGEDAFLDSFPQPERGEAWKLLAACARSVDLFLPVSRYFGDLMRERMELRPEKVRVLYPGISLEGYAPAPVPPALPVLGYLARMTPGKGLGLLIEAFILLRERGHIPGLQLRVGGSRMASDERFVDALRSRLRECGLEGEVEFFPNLDRDSKVRFLQGLSALSVPATYGEAFGLYILEALAAGVPVIQPRHAAFPELIEATAGGVLCEPEEPGSLAAAVEDLLSDPARAREIGEQGRRAVYERFSVERMAREIVSVCGQLSGTSEPLVAG